MIGFDLQQGRGCKGGTFYDTFAAFYHSWVIHHHAKTAAQDLFTHNFSTI